MSGLYSVFNKKWPTPIVKPLWPFFTAGVIVYYGVVKAAGAMADSEEFRNDPRNPALKYRSRDDSAHTQHPAS